jgi:hypothetical protein
MVVAAAFSGTGERRSALPESRAGGFLPPDTESLTSAYRRPALTKRRHPEVQREVTAGGRKGRRKTIQRAALCQTKASQGRHLLIVNPAHAFSRYR